MSSWRTRLIRHFLSSRQMLGRGRLSLRHRRGRRPSLRGVIGDRHSRSRPPSGQSPLIRGQAVRGAALVGSAARAMTGRARLGYATNAGRKDILRGTVRRGSRFASIATRPAIGRPSAPSFRGQRRDLHLRFELLRPGQRRPKHRRLGEEPSS